MAMKLMQNKIGAIVAIEPSTGEILAMVSSPTYDPSMLVGRERGRNYLKLNRDRYKPLFDRALMAAYPPGSTFKPTQGLIFLNEGIITEHTLYPCYHGFVSGRLKVGCHGHASPLSLLPALQTSCNAFFCYGCVRWSITEKISIAGEGVQCLERLFGIDGVWISFRGGFDRVRVEALFPTVIITTRYMAENDGTALTIISVAIGQGEVLATRCR